MSLNYNEIGKNIRPSVHEGLPAIGQEHADHFVTVRFLFRHLFFLLSV